MTLATVAGSDEGAAVGHGLAAEGNVQMGFGTSGGTITIALHLLLQAGLIVRALLRPHRDPASRAAWVVVIATLPVVGIVSYVLFGELRIGRRRIARMHAVWADLTLHARLTRPTADITPPAADLPERHAHVFRVGHSISGFPPVAGNRGRLLEDSNATIEALVADIDAARDHVHLCFYIWLADDNGLAVAEALKRAAARGVVCRAMADDLGSRAMIRSAHWGEMREAGVRLARALPIGNPLLRALGGRIDLRNHRKIVVIDDDLTYCGSQNCADPEFRIKAKYAPWVDAMIRFEGPVARQNQLLFASDWLANEAEGDARETQCFHELLQRPLPAEPGGFVAQAMGTGPSVRYSAMPEMFEALMYAARRELVITTPYYVPDAPMQAALCASARRGLKTTIVFPARNDSFVVAAASRSYYAELLEAGVHVFEYEGGLLHTKSLTVDDELTLIGSANMDRRSFDLNYENNILFCDEELTASVRRRQDLYLASARPVLAEDVAAWRWPRRLWNNAIAMLGPVL